MRILLTADLHSRRDWFEWLLRQQADLTVVAGDLLDGFRADGLLVQMLELRRWCTQFPGWLAVCSGNHDHNTPLRARRPEALAGIPEDVREEVLSLLLAGHWMDCLESDRVVTDRRTKVVTTPRGLLVVTTVPYDFDGGEDHDDLWEEAARLRHKQKIPWLVLHHEPPADVTVGGRMGNPQLYYKIQEYRPDFVVSGHLHNQPYVGSFADRLDGTWCFNPGHPEQGMAMQSGIPNHIVLDVAARTATWHFAPLAGHLAISETILLG
ncbi:MAG: metallophosphoesterase family protein [Verrucomicrobiota bacterium]